MVLRFCFIGSIILLVTVFIIFKIKMKHELNKTINIVTQQKNILNEMLNYHIDKIQDNNIKEMMREIQIGIHDIDEQLIKIKSIIS